MPKSSKSSDSGSSSSDSDSDSEKRVRKIAKRAKAAAQGAVFIRYKVKEALVEESKVEPPVYYVHTMAELAMCVADKAADAATATYSSLQHYELDADLHAGGRKITLDVANSLSKCAVHQALAAGEAHNALIAALMHHHTELASLIK